MDKVAFGHSVRFLKAFIQFRFLEDGPCRHSLLPGHGISLHLHAEEAYFQLHLYLISYELPLALA
jgi:hypothetical protein